MRITGNIKNILFDLGGVLLDIDARRTVEAFRKLGMPDLIRPGGWGYDHDVFLQMEQGLLNDQQFRDGIRSLLPQPATDEQIDHAWCAMLIDFNPKKIELLKKLKKKYKLYLFSNTNNIHINYFHELYRKKFGSSLSELFVKDYYSSDIRMRKPSLEAYRKVLNDAGINPTETLFIDDSEKNTESAAITGMQVICLHPDMNLQSLFSDQC